MNLETIVRGTAAGAEVKQRDAIDTASRRPVECAGVQIGHATAIINHLQRIRYGLGYRVNTHEENMDEERVQTKGVAVGEPVWVQCDGFRCLACLNHRGEWRAYSNNAKLPGTVKVLSIPSGKRHRF